MLKITSSKIKRWSSILKTAGISFTIEGANKISQQKPLNELCWDLLTYMSENSEYPKSATGDLYNTLVPDSSVNPDEGFEGWLNYYVHPGITPEDAKMYVEQAIQEHWLPQGIQASVEKVDTSRLMKLPTLRILVKKNDTQNLGKIPELHLNQTTGSTCLALLGLGEVQEQDSPLGRLSVPSNPDGSIDPKDLLARIPKAKRMASHYTQSPSQETRMFGAEEENPFKQEMEYQDEYDEINELENEQTKGRFEISNSGLDQEKIVRDLGRLEELATWAIQNNMGPIRWY